MEDAKIVQLFIHPSIVIMENPATIARALRLLESQRRASHNYYERNKERIKEKSISYWKTHKNTINERRRAAYALAHPPRDDAITPPLQ